MSEIDEFDQCVEEVSKLRALYLEMDENTGNSLQESVTKLAQKQVDTLESINTFLTKFTENSSIKERLECDNDTILMPDRDAVSDFVKFTNTAFRILNEISSDSKDQSAPDKGFYESQESYLNRIIYSDVSNKEFNRSYRGVVKYFSINSEDKNSRSEDSNNLTINTILSDDVSCSSPIEDKKMCK